MKDLLGGWLLRWRTNVVLPHVRGRLLDLGCGLNKLVRRYAGQGVGVDVHQWGDVDVILPDTSKLPFPDGSFETVTIVAALNHIPNRREVLAEVRRVLSAEGVLIVTMIPPTLSRVWHTLRRPWDVDHTERGMKDGKVFGMTGAQMEALLAESGFDIRHRQAFMLGLNRLWIGKKRTVNEGSGL